MDEVTEMLNKDECKKHINRNESTGIDENVLLSELKIDLLKEHITKTELKIKNFDSDHETITNLEIKYVKHQSIDDYIFIIGIMCLIAILAHFIDNWSALAFAISLCLLSISAAGVKIIRKCIYISRIRRQNPADNKKFLIEIFEGRINKLRKKIAECERNIDRLKREGKHS